MAENIFSSAFLSGRNFNSGFTPSPYVDMASSRAPSDYKRLFYIFEYYAKMDDVTAPAISKASEYPVMPIDYSKIIDYDKRTYLRTIIEDNMDVRGSIINMNMDYFTYGSSFTSISFPFKRWFECKKCKKRIFSDFVNSYSYQGGKFIFKCFECGDNNEKNYGDFYIKDKKKVRFIHWRPHDIEVVVHPFSGEEKIYYKPSSEVIRKVRSGDKFILDSTPKIILEAVRQNEMVVFGEDDIFHMKRSSVSSNHSLSGFGTSILLPCVIPGYTKKVLQKATEVSGIIRSAPAQILYPETNAAAGPQGNILMAGSVNLWQEHIKSELLKHRKDPGYIMTSPHPVGQQAIFGDSRNFNYYQEMRYQDEQLLSAIGFPRELLQGGLQFSSSSIALRILEVQLHKVSQLNNSFLRWMKNRLSHVFSFSSEEISMKKFRMADDLQMLQLQLQESGAGNLSKRRIWEGILDIDWKEEMDMVAEEDSIKLKSLRARAISDAEIQIKTNEIMSDAQMKMQTKLQAKQFEEQANMADKNPEYAKVLRQQQELQQQQMQYMQQQAALKQLDVSQVNAKSKEMQQDRLSSREVNLDEINNRIKNVHFLVEKINSGKVGIESALTSLLEKDEQTYNDVVLSFIKNEKGDLDQKIIDSVVNFVETNTPEILV